MEYLILRALINGLLWMDRLVRQPLGRAVPDLYHLLSDPRGKLARGAITIGPSRRYATAVFMAALASLLCSWILVIQVPAAAHRAAGRGIAALALAAVLGVALLVFLLILWMSRGGCCVLDRDGVLFCHRQITVYCPWQLFNTPRQPFMPTQDRMILPVSSHTIHLAEARKDDRVFAQGVEVRTRQFKFQSTAEAVLSELYEVNLLEVGELLLHVGRTLGRPVSATAGTS
jgi:hypothetical protein